MGQSIIISSLIFLVAVLMTMVGKGGGNFYVVILVMAGIPMHQAATTGQFILFTASLAAMIIFNKNKSVSWRLALLIGSITAVSALVGGYFSHIFSGFALKLIFAFMLVAAGAVMLIPGRKNPGKIPQKQFGTIKITIDGQPYGIIGGLIGSRFALKTKSRHLKKLFAYTNWLAGASMVINAFM